MQPCARHYSIIRIARILEDLLEMPFARPYSSSWFRRRWGQQSARLFHYIRIASTTNTSSHEWNVVALPHVAMSDSTEIRLRLLSRIFSPCLSFPAVSRGAAVRPRKATATATCKRLLMRVYHVATRYNNPLRDRTRSSSALSLNTIHPSSLVIARRIGFTARDNPEKFYIFRENVSREMKEWCSNYD